MKIIPWDNDKAKKELTRRLREAKDYRARFEGFWEKGEQLMFDAENSYGANSANSHPEYGTYIESSTLDSAQVNQNSAYAFRNLHYIHSQMSSNPPSVVAEPTSSDQDDRHAALGADRLIEHARKIYKLANKIDLMTQNTLVYGSGYYKSVWDSGLGSLIGYDKESEEYILEGDINVRIPSVWDIYLDQHAESWEDVRYVFQRMVMSLSTAQSQWPEYAEILEKNATDSNENHRPDSALSDTRPGKEVEVYEYWEKGLAENGYDGRYALHLKDGTVLGGIKPNPHRFLSAEAIRAVKSQNKGVDSAILEELLDQLPQKAELPYQMLTHIDIPNTVYGKSVLDYVGPIQDNLNRLMLTALDNAAAHGAVQLVLPEANEVDEDALVNTSFKVIKVSGPVGPYQLQMPALLGDLGPMMDREKMQIDDIMGVNDSQFGNMKRETSNAALQSAAAQGSMIRRRLFNKYTEVVEQIYRQFLKLIRKHVDIDRLYHMIGKEHPLEALEIKTMDLDGGYDLKVSYGSSLSLDPLTRRGEITQLMPIFEKAGMSTNALADMLQLNELRGMYDETRVAKERQQEIFDEMLETGTTIPPMPNQDHVNMLAHALRYVMTREFMDLDPQYQQLINQHIEDRKALAANEQATGSADPMLPQAPIPAGPQI